MPDTEKPTAPVRPPGKPYVLLIYAQRMIHKRVFESLDNLGLMSLAAYLEERGCRARVFTGIATDALQVYREESAKRPVPAVGLYCDYDNQSTVEALSRKLKEDSGLKVVVGGPQAMHLGGGFLAASGCDVLVRGDGEHALAGLMDLWTGGGDGSIKSLADIPGVLHLDGEGREAFTGERPLLDDLDALPLPGSHLLLRRPVKYNFSVIAARGCPFRCAFCFEGGNTKTLRLRSVENVCREIRRGLMENPLARYVWFADDTFTLSKKRTEDFCRGLAGLRREWDFIWFCEGHANILSRHPHLVPLMMGAGMARMQIGMESGWPPALAMYGKQATVLEIEAVIRTCWEAGLPQLHGNFIVGGAGETPETLDLTMDHVERLLRAYPGMLDVSTTFVMPLPNTEISRCPARFGLRILDPLSFTSVEDYPVTETDTLSQSRLCRARFEFVKRVSDTLKDLFRRGEIPEERIKSHFHLALTHGISSTWFKYLYARDPVAFRYFSLLEKTSAQGLDRVPSGDLDFWNPVLVFDLPALLEQAEGKTGIAGWEVSGPELDILWLCDGSRSWREIRGLLGRCSGGGSGHGWTVEAARTFLEEAAARRWLVFAPPWPGGRERAAGA